MTEQQPLSAAPEAATAGHEPAPADTVHVLRVEALSAAAFEPFGQVLEASEAAQPWTINAGYARRYPTAAQLDTAHDGGQAVVSIFRARARALPLQLDLVERHSLGSQAFMPLAGQRFLVVVAPPGPPPQMHELRCFLAALGQGVNYARGTWHHPLLALDADGDFLVIDRNGPGSASDCEELTLRTPAVWVHALDGSS